MNNAINTVLTGKKGLKLMAHAVAGYPDPARHRILVEALAANGADFIEIQIPFSDPLADGPTIMRANRRALENGIRPEDVLATIAQLKKTISIPIILMTYANIPFRMGWAMFAKRARDAGASGVIIPDLPFDETEGSKTWRLLERAGIHPIPVISPGLHDLRLRTIAAQVSGFIYLTLRLGTTGAVQHLDPAGLGFIERVRRQTALPVAAGFGISSADQIAALRDKVDVAILGSRLIDVFETAGIDGVAEFLRGCRTRIDES